jgi:hypothetical protein
MPVLSTTYYSNYSSSSLTRNPSSNLRPYSSSTYIPNKSRSSYDLTAYKPSSYYNSTHSTTTSSYKSPSSSLYTYNSNYNRWNSKEISGKKFSSFLDLILDNYYFEIIFLKCWNFLFLTFCDAFQKVFFKEVINLLKYELILYKQIFETNFHF